MDSTYDIVIYTNDGIWFEENDERVSTSVLIENEFKLIEDEIDIDKIDIDSIEEIDIDQVINTDDKTGIALLHINKLIRAVKQLNKEIKSIKEK